MIRHQTTNGIEVWVGEDEDEAADWVANHFVSVLQREPDSVLGLATGGTPLKTYQRLVEHHRERRVDFSSTVTFNLDEYIGLDRAHPQSYRHYMNTHLFDQIDIDHDRTHVPDGCAVDIAQQCDDYENRIVAVGGIDLQLLGIGHNGHIAFNEPGSAGDSRTRAVDLTAATISKNARFFSSIELVPRSAITMGIGTILEARQILLLATGAGKADAVKRTLLGTVHESHPASHLQRHSNVIVVLDKAASKDLFGAQNKSKD